MYSLINSYKFIGLQHFHEHFWHTKYMKYSLGDWIWLSKAATKAPQIDLRSPDHSVARRNPWGQGQGRLTDQKGNDYSNDRKFSFHIFPYLSIHFISSIPNQVKYGEIIGCGEPISESTSVKVENAAWHRRTPETPPQRQSIRPWLCRTNQAFPGTLPGKKVSGRSLKITSTSLSEPQIDQWGNHGTFK